MGNSAPTPPPTSDSTVAMTSAAGAGAAGADVGADAGGGGRTMATARLTRNPSGCSILDTPLQTKNYKFKISIQIVDFVLVWLTGMTVVEEVWGVTSSTVGRTRLRPRRLPVSMMLDPSVS